MKDMITRKEFIKNHYLCELSNAARHPGFCKWSRRVAAMLARAEWRRENGRLAVFIELRDRNYPGSHYTLRYVPEEDALVGTYFQAVHKQTFDIIFIRQQ